MFQLKSSQKKEIFIDIHKSGKYITFLPENRNVLSSHVDETLLDVALANGVKINHSCGGNGTCGTCHVYIRSKLNTLEPRNEIEAEMADCRGFDENERLACQLRAQPGLIVEIG